MSWSNSIRPGRSEAAMSYAMATMRLSSPDPFLGIVLAILMAGVPLKAAAQQQTAFRKEAAAAVRTLDRWYDDSSGQYRTAGWWNNANAMTAVVDYMRLSGDTTYLRRIRRTFEKCRLFYIAGPGGMKIPIRNFLNDYYDDEGWWALAWVDAYDLTRDQAYLAAARILFADMVAGWSDACGGGVWWKKPDHGKNAIENELFMLMAVRLHERTRDTARIAGRTCLEWSLVAWRWIRQKGLLNRDFLVEDGLNQDCQAVHSRNYTYNQGVILSGLDGLAAATGNRGLLDTALAIAHAAMKHLVYPDGILREPTEPHCNQDAIQFKGIFMRHLAGLYLQTGDTAVRSFIRYNAAHLWTRARDTATGEIGSIWEGPFDAGDAGRQASAIDALNAAMAVRALR